jgi:hypothetical protein
MITEIIRSEIPTPEEVFGEEEIGGEEEPKFGEFGEEFDEDIEDE